MALDATAPVPPSAPQQPSHGRANVLGDALRSLVRWETALVVLLVAVFGIGAESSDQFLTNYNLETLCTNIGDIAIIALPMTLIVIVGEIDLSVASILALASEMLGYLTLHHWPLGADLRHRARARRGRRRAQRLPRDRRRPAVAGGHDRHAHPVPRAGDGRPRAADRVELPGVLDQPRRRLVPRRAVDVVVGGDLHRAGDRVRARPAPHVAGPAAVRDRAQQRGGRARRDARRAGQDGACSCCRA